MDLSKGCVSNGVCDGHCFDNTLPCIVAIGSRTDDIADGWCPCHHCKMLDFACDRTPHGGVNWIEDPVLLKSTQLPRSWGKDMWKVYGEFWCKRR